MRGTRPARHRPDEPQQLALVLFPDESPRKAPAAPVPEPVQRDEHHSQPALLPARRACKKCGARLSKYASRLDEYCAPCHPHTERPDADLCRNGHDLAEFGVWAKAGRGKTALRCTACRRQQARDWARNRADKETAA